MRNRKILFVHDNFPAQFGQFGAWLARSGWDVAFATAREDARSDVFRLLRYKPHREPSPKTHPYARSLDKAALNAQGFARTAFAARAEGYAPDVVMAHAGWGAGMFARDIFPGSKCAPLCEWWYRTPAADASFLARSASDAPGGPLPEREQPLDIALLQDSRNAPMLFDLANADAAFCPTRFQAAQFPSRIRSWLTVLHEGIDVAQHAPDPSKRRSTLGGLVPEDAEVVTYATRGQEPHRGFPQFIRALPRLFAERPKAHAVIAGENRVAYGGQQFRDVDWCARSLAEVEPDRSRIHFTGPLPRARYVELLQRSDAHVYLTVPFVLSWSMLEAMSTGCLLVASDTEPVREFATDDETALLTDFFDHDALAGRLIEALSNPERGERIRAQARMMVVESLSAQHLFHRRREILLDLLDS